MIRIDINQAISNVQVRTGANVSVGETRNSFFEAMSEVAGSVTENAITNVAEVQQQYQDAQVMLDEYRQVLEQPLNEITQLAANIMSGGATPMQKSACTCHAHHILNDVKQKLSMLNAKYNNVAHNPFAQNIKSYVTQDVQDLDADIKANNWSSVSYNASNVFHHITQSLLYQKITLTNDAGKEDMLGDLL